MKNTIANRIANGLIRLGYLETKPTTHYRVFMVPQSKCRYYVGRAGALRISNAGKVTESVSCSDMVKAEIMGPAGLDLEDLFE